MTCHLSGVPKFLKRHKAHLTWALTVLFFGAVEMIWITIYRNLSGGDTIAVASGVTEALFSSRLPEDAAVPLGVAIETGIAFLFGIAIYLAVSLPPRRRALPLLEAGIVVGSLVVVWAMNFYLVLPTINPAYTIVIPHTTSLAFDVLFGAMAALVLYLCDSKLLDTTAAQATSAQSASTSKWASVRLPRLPRSSASPRISSKR